MRSPGCRGWTVSTRGWRPAGSRSSPSASSTGWWPGLLRLPGTEIYYHTPSATLVSIFLGICSTYLVTAVHLLKRICGANIPEICTHISVLCKCIHTKGYCMHTSTKYPPIYPPLIMYSYEECLVQTYSKYSHTYTN